MLAQLCWGVASKKRAPENVAAATNTLQLLVSRCLERGDVELHCCRVGDAEWKQECVAGDGILQGATVWGPEQTVASLKRAWDKDLDP
jgi:hypothetical protein